MSVSDIDTTTKEGKLLLAALSMLSTKAFPNEEPDVILKRVEYLAWRIYPICVHKS